MKNLLIIDAKYTLYKKLSETFTESFRNGLKMIAGNFKIELKSESQFEEQYGALKSSLDVSGPLKKRMQQLLDSFFGVDVLSAEKVIDFINESSGKDNKLLFQIDRLFNYADLSYIKMHYEVVLFASTTNPIKQLMLTVLLGESIDIELLSFNKITQIENWSADKIFIVSQRPFYIRDRVLSGVSHGAGFNYKTNFIYFTLPEMKYEKIQKFNEEANVLSIYWEVFSLKLLAQKLIMVNSYAKGELDLKKLKHIGLFFDQRLIKTLIEKNYLHDFYPIVFELHDPLSNRFKDDIHIFFSKLWTIARRHGKLGFEGLEETCKQITEIHIAMENKLGRSIIDINNTSGFLCFVRRSLMAELFGSILNDPKFNEELVKRCPSATITFPRTELLSSSLINDIPVG